MDDTKLLFAGTPDFAVPTLQRLLESAVQVVAVYTQPDRPAGRGRRLAASPVKQLALERGIPVKQPATLKTPEAVSALDALQADLMVVVAYGLLLPTAVLQAPRLGCINVHASLLPRWRGAAPIQRALLAGDTETGITIMGMEAGLDTGPMYLKHRTRVRPDDTGASLHDRLALLGADALMEALPGILGGRLTPEPQDPACATYAQKISKDEALIDWSRPAAEIERQIRAFNPWPIAETRAGSMTLRIWEGELTDKESADPPGTVVATSKNGIEVATADRLLRLTRLQAPGKRPMTAAEYLNARSLDGERLG